MRRTVSLAAVLCLIIAGITVACSGGNTEPAACTYKMTGAQNGTYPCQVLVIASPELTSVVIVPTSLQGAPIKGLGAQWVLHRGVSFLPTTFNSGNVEQADIFVAGGTSVWDMSLHATDQTNHPDQGNFVLNVTSAGSRLSLGTATVWAHAQGTATGTLPAEKNTSASGEISVEIVFTDSVSSPAGITIPGTSSDAGTTDAGSADAGTTDAGSSDGGRDAGTDGGGTDGGGGDDGGGGGLNVQEMRRDAFWLQRRVAQAFGGMDADTAQALAEKVFVTLQVRRVPRLHRVLGSFQVLDRLG